MSFEKGKPIKNLIYGLTHPLKMARDKPIMFLLAAGAGVYFIGVASGWWSMSAISKMIPFVK
tara:strand:+ start:8416 stop:8601 length:186 start_codon:yes stop_codon:yes gene_type:complete